MIDQPQVSREQDPLEGPTRLVIKLLLYKDTQLHT